MPNSSSDLLAHPKPGVISLTLEQAMQLAFAAYARGSLGEAASLCRQALNTKADHFDALNLLGTIAIQVGHGQEAAELLRRAVAARPGDAAARINFGVALQNLKRPGEAMESYRQAIKLKPDLAEAHNNLGFSLQELGRPGDALASYDRAIALKPDYAEAHTNRGNALQHLKRLDEALASHERVTQLRPEFAEAHNNRGIVLQALARTDEALDSYAQAIRLKPDYAEAHNNRGTALQQLKRLDEALKSYERAIELKTDFAEAYNHRGTALQVLERLDEARDSHEQAIKLKPEYAASYGNLGLALRKLGRLNEALAIFDRALELQPGNAEAHNHRGVVLRELGRLDESLASYDRALDLRPDYIEACNNRGNALRQAGLYADAARSFTQVLASAPEFSFAPGNLLHVKMLSCDWADLAELYQTVRRGCLARKPSAEPFGHQAICDSERELRICAETFAALRYPSRDLSLLANPRTDIHSRKIRIGYVSGEFRHQATSLLMTELFELHDRGRFEIFAFDNGWDDGSETRARINRAFAEIVDISRSSDLEAASLVEKREIDILVNLNGYFGEARQGVFAYRPSPVQVNYLGFPGTIGAEYMDYLIADHTVIPESSRQHYTEKIAYLPDCYQVNDSKRAIANRTFSREELGLPTQGFVFCCFNHTYKITPRTFDSWMRILDRVEGSVLWLLESNPEAVHNLRKECTNRNVDPRRLIFAPHLALGEHLARIRAADLFIDTLPYNAHTTASDALWSGLPLLTLVGQTFAGRVAASLLKAIDMPELVTTTQENFEALAVELATHPRRLMQIRNKLERNRLMTPLFDTRLFTRHIEDAYAKMYGRLQADLPPDHIFVTS